MQLPSFSACLVGIKWFCLKVSCFARPIFPGPLREKGLCCGLCDLHSAFLRHWLSQQLEYLRPKSTQDTLWCVFWVLQSLARLLSLILSELMFVLWIMSKVFSCTWWEEYRKVCLLHIPGPESLKCAKCICSPMPHVVQCSGSGRGAAHK